MKILFPLLLSLVTATVDYSTNSWFDDAKQLQKSLPSNDFVTLPATLSVADLEVLHQYCVDEINKYRSGVSKFSDFTDDPEIVGAGRDPLIPAKEWYSCSSAQAKGDLKVNWEGSGGCLGAHSTAFDCDMGGYQGQNSCCGRGGGSFGSDTSLDTLSKVQSELDHCLRMMWDEGLDPTQEQGHWENMRSDVFTHVTCGFAWTSNGRVMMTQDFTSKSPSCTQPDCSTGTLQWDPNQCSPKSKVPTKCFGTPPPSPPPTPSPTLPPTSPTTPPPTPPTPPPTPNNLPTDEAMQGSCPQDQFQTCSGICWRPFSVIKTLFQSNWQHDRFATCTGASSPDDECCGATYCGKYQSYCDPGGLLYQDFNCTRLGCGNPYCQTCSNPSAQGFSKNTQTKELKPFLGSAVTKEDPNEKQPSSGTSIFCSSSTLYLIVSICLFFF